MHESQDLFVLYVSRLCERFRRGLLKNWEITSHRTCSAIDTIANCMEAISRQAKN